MLTALGACERAEANGFPGAEARSREAIPLVEVAASAPAAEFTDVTALDVDSRGRIYVGDFHRRQVTVLDSGGALVRKIGRKGGGPGEFEAIRGMQVLAGDTLLVYDPALARVSVFAPDSDRPAYTTNLGARTRRGAPFHLWRTRAGDGYLALYRPAFVFSGGETAERRRDVVGTLALDGAPRGDSILAFPSRSFVIAPNGAMENPFGRQGIVRLDSRDRVHVVWTDSARVAAYDLAGRKTGGFGFPFDAPPVTGAQARREVEALDDFARGMFERPLADSVPERWPAVRDLLVDDRDRIWLALGGDARAETEWAVFTPEGRYLASTVVPAGVTVRAVRGGRLYAERPDEDGVPRVVVFRLGRLPD